MALASDEEEYIEEVIEYVEDGEESDEEVNEPVKLRSRKLKLKEDELDSAEAEASWRSKVLHLQREYSSVPSAF
jgi:hypothetical protein